MDTLLSLARPSDKLAILAGPSTSDLVEHGVFERLPNLVAVDEDLSVYSASFGEDTEVGRLAEGDEAFPPGKLRDLGGRVIRASAVPYLPFFSQVI